MEKESQEKPDFHWPGLLQRSFSVWICWYVPDLTCLLTLCMWHCWISNLQSPWQSPLELEVTLLGGSFFPGSENALWLHMVIDRDFEFSKLNGSQVQVFHPCSTLVKLRTMSRLLRSGFASLLPLGSGSSLLHSPQ